MPVDQACGLQAVGYSTGYLVSSRSYSREDQLSASVADRAWYTPQVSSLFVNGWPVTRSSTDRTRLPGGFSRARTRCSKMPAL